MWVFLDIDGVLVPEKKFENCNSSKDFWNFAPICLVLFESVLQVYSNIKVGISSTWRDLFTIEKIRSLFSENIATRVVGFTPILDSERDGVSQYYRYFEIQAFLKDRHAENDSWVAINDSRLYYPPNTKVVVTDPYYGLDANSAVALMQHLAALSDSQSDLPLLVTA